MRFGCSLILISVAAGVTLATADAGLLRVEGRHPPSAEIPNAVRSDFAQRAKSASTAVYRASSPDQDLVWSSAAFFFGVLGISLFSVKLCFPSVSLLGTGGGRQDVGVQVPSTSELDEMFSQQPNGLEYDESSFLAGGYVSPHISLLLTDDEQLYLQSMQMQGPGAEGAWSLPQIMPQVASDPAVHPPGTHRDGQQLRRYHSETTAVRNFRSSLPRAASKSAAPRQLGSSDSSIAAPPFCHFNSLPLAQNAASKRSHPPPRSEECEESAAPYAVLEEGGMGGRRAARTVTGRQASLTPPPLVAAVDARTPLLEANAMPPPALDPLALETKHTLRAGVKSSSASALGGGQG